MHRLGAFFFILPQLPPPITKIAQELEARRPFTFHSFEDAIFLKWYYLHVNSTLCKLYLFYLNILTYRKCILLFWDFCGNAGNHALLFRNYVSKRGGGGLPNIRFCSLSCLLHQGLDWLSEKSCYAIFEIESARWLRTTSWLSFILNLSPHLVLWDQTY